MTNPRQSKLFPFVCGCWCLAVLLLGCQTPSTKSPSERSSSPEVSAPAGVLRVGISPTMPPLIYRQEGQIVGLEAELADGLAKHIDYRLEFVEVDWNDQIDYLLEGRTDIIMSGMSVTDMRRIRIAFCEPYAKTGQMALIRRQEIKKFKDGYYALVEIPSIGAIRDTTGDLFIRSRFPDTHKLFFDTLDDGVRAVIRDKIDILFYDAPSVVLAAAKFENHLAFLPKIYQTEYLAWGVRKNNPDLLQKANAYIAALKADGRLQEMVNRWIPFVDN